MIRKGTNMSIDNRSKYYILALALVAVALGSLLLSRESGQASAEPVPNDPPLEVLEPASPEDVEEQPPAVQQQLEFAASGVSERNSEESVEVTSLGESEVPGEGSVAVAEVGPEICAFQTGQIGNCADQEEISQGRIFTATPVGCAAYEVLGIVDDRVDSLRVTPEGGQTYPVEVHENIYLDSFAAERTLIEGLDVAGNPVFVNWLPLDEYQAQNDACQGGAGSAG
jgi:hypothetical protein